MAQFAKILASPERRRQLVARKHHYPYKLAAGRFLGYLKPLGYTPRWVAVGYTGKNRYIQAVLGKTDDRGRADGKSVLTFSEAQHAAHAWLNHPDRHGVLIEAHPIQHKGQLCICPVGAEYTVGHALRDYFAWKRESGSSERSIGPSVATANAYIVPLLANRPAVELRSKDFRRFLTTISTVPKTLIGICEPDKSEFERLVPEVQQTRKKRANSVYAILRSAMQRAWQLGKIYDDRPWRMVKPFMTNPAEPPFIPSPEHVSALLHASEPALRNLIQVCYLTGCALREALQFEAGWVSLSDGMLSIPERQTNRPRTLPLSSQAIEFLSTALALTDTSELLFPSCKGRGFTHPRAYYRFAVVREKAGLPRGFTFRSLRDAHAVALLSAGLSVAYVARQTGLANTTVLNRYAHSIDDFIDQDLRTHFPFTFETDLQGADT